MDENKEILVVPDQRLDERLTERLARLRSAQIELFSRTQELEKLQRQSRKIPKPKHELEVKLRCGVTQLPLTGLNASVKEHLRQYRKFYGLRKYGMAGVTFPYSVLFIQFI